MDPEKEDLYQAQSTWIALVSPEHKVMQLAVTSGPEGISYVILTEAKVVCMCSASLNMD